MFLQKSLLLLPLEKSKQDEAKMRQFEETSFSCFGNWTLHGHLKYSGIRKPDVSGFWMVDLGSVHEWSDF